ncbi:hypothetical protein DAPPUDRAFT_110436 [Daphnia pulex]|uniref:Uncharacterized protein n=1 Tax=Daphnia pulex TaxID=6669 RepID=E9H694_DAPPU|nr:hypothetical protein DAPPUDRAFT_110436 [Daphnia pulex]|eukprot:EFX72736.1 hypothetical protein DAPPUDRAFT_110436 [Daphnia pulex]
MQSLSGPTTYLVAPNKEVLTQLMRDIEARTDAGNYTAPASTFNTFTVEFSHTSCSNSNPASPQHKCKTKGRKNQPVYANIMMADATPPSAAIAVAAVATNPAPYKDVRGLAHVESNNTHPQLVGVCMEPNEPSREHMEQERRMLEWKLCSRNRIVAGWPKKRAIWANEIQLSCVAGLIPEQKRKSFEFSKHITIFYRNLPGSVVFISRFQKRLAENRNLKRNTVDVVLAQLCRSMSPTHRR